MKKGEKAGKDTKNEPMPMEVLAETMAKSVVENPGNIKATRLGTKDVTIEISGINKDDFGRFFGKKGRNFKRLIEQVKAAASVQRIRLRRIEVLGVPEKSPEEK